MGTRDDLPIFRPKMGGGPKPTSAGGVARFRNTVLASVRQRAPRSAGSARKGRLRVATSPAKSRSRRVIVKARVVKMAGRSAKAAALHLAYIEREGVEKDGSKGVLYGAEGPASRKAFEEPLPGEKHQFRLIVSPEDGHELDLTDYVRRYMAGIEKELGRKLVWAAVNHHDTDHPHAHIVVRGVDRDGRDLRLDRDFVAHGLRARAEELATEELGPRKEQDVQRQKQREIAQDRFTSLDRELAGRAKEGRVEVRGADSGRRDRAPPELLLARLEHLERLRLAERISGTSWSLAPKWQEQLRELGMRGDILHQMHQALRGDPARYRMLLPGQEPGGREELGLSHALPARVVRKGLSDEMKGSFYAIIETARGDGYYVPLDRRSAEQLREGDVVSFGTGPRHERHERSAATMPHKRPEIPSERIINDKEGPRLHEARLPGAKHSETPDGTLHASMKTKRALDNEQVGNYQQRENSEEQRRAAAREQHQMYPPLRLDKQAQGLNESIHRVAPVWLDRVAPNELAPYGFGAQVRQAIEERHRFLRDHGVDPADPKRFHKLRELERQKIAHDFALASGERFVGDPPKGFRGRVKMLEPSQGSGRYAVVTDGSRFAVVAVTHDVKALDGKAVTLSRDREGRPIVRGAEKDRGRA